jgi:hypothetical protein
MRASPPPSPATTKESGGHLGQQRGGEGGWEGLAAVETLVALESPSGGRHEGREDRMILSILLNSGLFGNLHEIKIKERLGKARMRL